MNKISKLLTIFFLFIVLVQSIYAISHVQHTVNGNKITLSYQGTPPFLINIRSDSNIGQGGGYVWAKTNLNSFTLDLSFANNPSNKFYYGIKDRDWSNTLSFSIGDSAAQDCVYLLNNGPTASKIDLVIIPDAYLTKEEIDEFVLTTKEYLGLTGNEGLFNIEPFKSNKHKFNVYYINKSIVLGGCYSGGNCNHEKINQLKTSCPSVDEIVVIFNTDYYNSEYVPKASARTCNHFASATGHTDLEEFRPNQLAHEFGHSFGCLKDLYFTQRYSNIDPNWPNVDVFGCPKWCDGEPIISEPTNQDCIELLTKNECETAIFWPNCEWFNGVDKCLPQSISGACSIYDDEFSCINAYTDLSNFECTWYPPPYADGYCGIKDSTFNVGSNCREGYGCYQGAEGLAGYGAEPSRDTIMGYMVELRYDIASYEHLLNLLNNYS